MMKNYNLTLYSKYNLLLYFFIFSSRVLSKWDNSYDLDIHVVPNSHMDLGWKCTLD